MLKQIFNNTKNNELDSLKTKVSELEKEVATAKTDVIEISNDFERLETETVEVGETTDKTIKTLRAELCTVKTDLDNYKKEFVELHKYTMNTTRFLKTQINQLRQELTEVKGNYSQLENQIAEVPVIVIGETSIAESVLSYHLRTSPQTQSKNYRYFYRSNYLFTAPLNLKNLLTIEFNRLMNSNLSFENVVEELKVYKTSLENELKSNGIQTDLGAVLNE